MSFKEKNEKSDKNEPMGLTEALAQIRKNYGEGAVLQGSNIVVKGIESLSTGTMSLDLALGIGGIPKGRITEIFGPEASGKTTLCLEIIARVQHTGGKAAFIDVEHALDLKYAQNGPGVDIDQLLLSQPDSGEEAITICELLAKSGEVNLIVLDSVAALVPQAELDGDVGDAVPGAQARLMSKSLRRLKGVLNKTNTALIFVNQIREKIGVFFGSPETRPGGRALGYYASVRIDIRRIEGIKEKGEDVPSGSRVKAKIAKNKVASPFKIAEFDIIFGKGIDKIGSVIEVAENLGIIKKAGSMFKYDDKSFNGRTRLTEYITSKSEILESLDNTVRDQLKLRPIVEVSNELETVEDSIEINASE